MMIVLANAEFLIGSTAVLLIVSQDGLHVWIQHY